MIYEHFKKNLNSIPNHIYLFFFLKKFKLFINIKKNKILKTNKKNLLFIYLFLKFYFINIKIVKFKYYFLNFFKIGLLKIKKNYNKSNKSIFPFIGMKRNKKLFLNVIFKNKNINSVNIYYVASNSNIILDDFLYHKKSSKIILKIYIYYNIKYNYFIKNNKNVVFKSFNKNVFLSYLTSNIDIGYNFFFSNKYLINLFLVSDFNKFIIKGNNNNKYYYNNYYPIFLNKYVYFNFFKKFNFNHNINYIIYTNKIIITFLEYFLKKKIFLKVSNNKINKIKNNYFNHILNEYRNFQPLYFKKFLISDFIEIIWYSFLLKDLKMLSDWISKFMESLNFKNHKKFLTFFNNFLIKYSSLFMDVLKIKGFLFDIRGKVGVTGSSKKRHFCFKFGSLNKSSKKYKMSFNQNLVRTYSGVMGLTYIISY